MIITRRGFMSGMLALGAAPAIVRAASLMPLVVPSREIITVVHPLLKGELGSYEGIRLTTRETFGPMTKQAMREWSERVFVMCVGPTQWQELIDNKSALNLK